MFGLGRKKIALGAPDGKVALRAEVDDSSRRLSRGQLLRKAAAGLAGAVAGAVAAGLSGSKVAKAAGTNNPLLLGNSGNASDPNLAEDATEVQYDGAGPPLGVVFLAQADNKWTPSQAGFPAAVAGWTSTNANIPNGVYGYTERPDGSGVVGAAVGPNSRGVLGESFGPSGVGGAFVGPNRAPLNLHPEPSGPPPGQPGDFYVTINVDNFATLWFHTGVQGWQRVVTTP